MSQIWAKKVNANTLPVLSPCELSHFITRQIRVRLKLRSVCLWAQNNQRSMLFKSLNALANSRNIYLHGVHGINEVIDEGSSREKNAGLHTTEEVRRKIQSAIGEYDELLTMVKK